MTKGERATAPSALGSQERLEESSSLLGPPKKHKEIGPAPSKVVYLVTQVIEEGLRRYPGKCGQPIILRKIHRRGNRQVLPE